MPRRANRYVDNEEMYREIIEFTETGVVSETLHMIIWKMCNHIINRPRFNRYSVAWKEDMKSSAYVKCITVITEMKYKTDRTNPFSYFTTVISNCFLDHTVAEKKQKRIRNKLCRMYGYDEPGQSKPTKNWESRAK